MLPANFVAVNVSGPIMFDNSLIANLTLKNTDAFVELPLLPGSHTLTINNKTKNLHFFDYVCDFEGILACNVTAHANIIVPFHISCGTHPYGELEMKEGQTYTIQASGECKTAYIQIGDYNESSRFVEVFKNYVILSRPGNISISKDGNVILKKYGRNYVGFPELEKGVYWMSSDTGLEGKLIIDAQSTSIYGYALSVIVVISALALLWKG